MKNGIACDQVIKMMNEVIDSIMEPVSKACYEALEPYDDDTKVTMLYDDVDFIADELHFLKDCLHILAKRTSAFKDEA